MTRSLFLLVFGTILGAYISQNYNIPDVKNIIDTGIKKVMVVEEKMRIENSNKNNNDLKKN